MKSKKEPVEFIDRITGNLCKEMIAGERSLRFCYSTKPGKWLVKHLVRHRFVSRFYGGYQSTRFSKRHILPFAKSLKIDLEESLLSIHQFRTFNEFFSRKLKPGARPIASQDIIMPADGRVFVIQTIQNNHVFQIKGHDFRLSEFLGEHAKNYEGATLVIVRLCPSDYHRFHFPLEGIAKKPILLCKGSFYSVNPLAIKAYPDIFCKNERQITQVLNEKIGEYLFIEIGATMVGKIVHTFSFDQRVEKGQEKGYFLFGASTVVLCFPKNTITLDQDLVENSKQNLETLCKMGQSLASFCCAV